MITVQKQSQRVITKEAAAYIGVKVETLHYWCKVKKGPRYYKFGRRRFYAIKDLDTFIESRAIEPAA